jgi:hypothetical protein
LPNFSTDSKALPGKTVVGLERGPLSFVSTTEELLDRKVAAPVYKTENTTVGIRHVDHVAPSIRKKLAITSPTIGGLSVSIVRSWAQIMEFFFSWSITAFSRDTNSPCSQAASYKLHVYIQIYIFSIILSCLLSEQFLSSFYTLLISTGL